MEKPLHVITESREEYELRKNKKISPLGILAVIIILVSIYLFYWNKIVASVVLLIGILLIINATRRDRRKVLRDRERLRRIRHRR